MSHTERHRTAHFGWLRAAVLGANDGLISTASLVIGVAASGTSRPAVLIAGVAGLTSGSMAMAAGEYVSVSSQADRTVGARARTRGVDPALSRHSAHPQHRRPALGCQNAALMREARAMTRDPTAARFARRTFNEVPMPDDNKTNHAVPTAADRERGPIGAGSEATEGIHDVDMKGGHKRTGLEHRTPGTQPGLEPLRERAWVHESGYGGKRGKPRTSSDARESEEQHPAPTPLPVPPPKGKSH